MQQVTADIWAAFERRLDQAQVPTDQRPDYHKWVRFYQVLQPQILAKKYTPQVP
jgi:hypothetical protein